MLDALMGVARSREASVHGTVVAAGNESRRHLDRDVEIAVSLSAAGLPVADSSNTFPHVSGPGVSVRSARAGGGPVELNGTSTATPHVAGVAALWWEKVARSQVPHTVQAVAAKLLATASTEGFAPDVDVADRGSASCRRPERSSSQHQPRLPPDPAVVLWSDRTQPTRAPPPGSADEDED